MCGRATLTVSVDEIAEVLGATPIEVGPPRYNLAPSQPMLIVREGRDHAREMALARWGLVPHWAREEEVKKLASRCVQARVETVARAPAFRDAFRARRCLVIVDGFYEWKTLEGGGRSPHHVRREDGRPFAIAGVWERWRSPSGEIVDSCAVVTTEAAGRIAELHDRMPLVVPPNAYAAWLGGTSEEASHVVSAAPELVVSRVSKWVNDVRHDDPRCLDPEPEAQELGQIALRFAR